MTKEEFLEKLRQAASKAETVEVRTDKIRLLVRDDDGEVEECCPLEAVLWLETGEIKFFSAFYNKRTPGDNSIDKLVREVVNASDGRDVFDLEFRNQILEACQIKESSNE